MIPASSGGYGCTMLGITHFQIIFNFMLDIVCLSSDMLGKGKGRGGMGDIMANIIDGIIDGIIDL
jgi:hypothetical protein